VALRSDWSQDTCPIARSVDVVGDPWVLLVLREAFEGATRFEQFRALGIADNVLSRRLSGMVDAGLLERSPYVDGNRRRDEYVLTDAGADLLPVLHALALWGEKHRPATTGRMELVHEVCGRATTSADTCTSCHVPVTAADVSWRLPRDPGSLLPLAR
jgi:DNA-binding HxlR family transcriptional regulator